MARWNGPNKSSILYSKLMSTAGAVHDDLSVGAARGWRPGMGKGGGHSHFSLYQRRFLTMKHAKKHVCDRTALGELDRDLVGRGGDTLSADAPPPSRRLRHLDLAP